MTTASGTFEIEMTPGEPPPNMRGTASFTFTKTFHGDLTGTSNGLMLSAGDPATGEAGYVAVEVVTGSLGDRSGTFALQQLGAMHAGESSIEYLVVPGSGTAGFTGNSGRLELTIVEGVHHYTLTLEP